MTVWILVVAAVLITALMLVVLRSIGPRVPGPRRTLLFLALVLLPLLWLVGALSHVDGTMKSVGFCLGCHEMATYGESLTGVESLAAAHYDGGWVDRERACYDCHTESTLAGEIGAKLRGMHDLRVHYLGTVPERIELAEPYPNGICLSCHGREESFLAVAGHEYPETLFEDVVGGDTSCLECHAPAH